MKRISLLICIFSFIFSQSRANLTYLDFDPVLESIKSVQKNLTDIKKIDISSFLIKKETKNSFYENALILGSSLIGISLKRNLRDEELRKITAYDPLYYSYYFDHKNKYLPRY